MICVDASVAAKWLFQEPDSDKAVALLGEALQLREHIVVPYLLRYEMTNVIWQRVRAEKLDRADAPMRLADFLALPLSFEDEPSLFTASLAITSAYGLPATYDACYIALAQSMTGTLWTADERLLRVLAGSLPFVRPIADYSPSRT